VGDRTIHFFRRLVCRVAGFIYSSQRTAAKPNLILKTDSRETTSSGLVRPAVTIIYDSVVGMSKRMASEETGWKPVCRDRRGRLSSQIMVTLSITTTETEKQNAEDENIQDSQEAL
jgi:hypothetical protein